MGTIDTRNISFGILKMFNIPTDNIIVGADLKLRADSLPILSVEYLIDGEYERRSFRVEEIMKEDKNDSIDYLL